MADVKRYERMESEERGDENGGLRKKWTAEEERGKCLRRDKDWRRNDDLKRRSGGEN